ncbi:hypothetical protein V5O48_013784 [Marasmius crinis-equi]|uniref:Uncharacterized protein n=1 Tax=Marasmius crinis-equi TaxID=585013 RepID=A0ABR3EZ47_9AGAR
MSLPLHLLKLAIDQFSRGIFRWLIAGSAIAEQFDEVFEEGEGDTDCEDAEEARESFVEIAHVAFVVDTHLSASILLVCSLCTIFRFPFYNIQISLFVPGDEDQIRDLLAEALLTLANLRKDEERRDEPYARAEKESRSGHQLGAEEEEEWMKS